MSHNKLSYYNLNGIRILDMTLFRVAIGNCENLIFTLKYKKKKVILILN